jgi:nitroimidazol reductase NimA-like FMN-containing flavoprotein (pyridoxamine 5'-phosphate oxidase superfamily)
MTSVIDRDECLRLVSGSYVGRIGLSVAALPVVLPVNYVWDVDRIVLCTEPGAKLDAARHGLVACLEVDDFDPVGHRGWSVLVTGRLTDLRDPAELARAQRLPLAPWMPMTDPHFLALSAELVTGRRLPGR